MGYRFAGDRFRNEHPLTHLSAAEARLSAALSQPRRIALGCVAALTALGWLALGLMSAGSPLNWQALCQPGAPGGWSDLALAAPMWMAMTLAMMLPTAGPMILTYAEIADTAARKARAGGVAARSDRGLCRGLARLCACGGVAAIRAGARGPARRRQRRAARRRHDLSRRRPLSILRAQAGLPDAVPAAVSVLLFELDHGDAAACCGSACGRACFVSAAAGR